MGEEKLREQFGKFGEWLYTKSCGRDIDAYAYGEEPKSISHETTFDEDIDDLEEFERTLSYLAQLVARRLRDHGLFAHTLGLKLRYAPFKTLTRDITIDEPTNLDSVIFDNVLRLFESLATAKKKVRLVGVRASNLERAVFQRNLLEAPQREKLDKILQSRRQAAREVRLRSRATGALPRDGQAAQTPQAPGVPGAGELKPQ